MPADASSAARSPDLADPISQSDHIIGNPSASVTLVEYGDYECPTCTLTFPHVQALLDTYSDRLRFVFRHFPLTSVHPHASMAAQAAEAAGAQGKFWPMHALLYGRPGGLELDDLDGMALRLGLEVYRFQSELSTGTWAPKVQRQAEGGRRSGVTGTPTFFLNGRRLSREEGDENALKAAVQTAVEKA